MPLDPTQVARFAADVRRLLGAEEPGPERPLALAVSGGPDSMALLALAAGAFPGAAIAATVDHRLRQESAGEAAMVADWCDRAGVRQATLGLAKLPSGNLHDRARTARYRALASWADGCGAIALATAHHADDQAETFLMRAMRGSGIAGLSGVRASTMLQAGRTGVKLIRPLLSYRRAELCSIAAAADMPTVDDPANADPRFLRSRLRGWLAEASWLPVEQFARSAAHLAELDDELNVLTDVWWTERQRPAALAAICLDVAGLPREVRRRLVRRGLAELQDPFASEAAFDAVEPLLDALDAGRAATQAEVLVRPSGDLWTFSRAPPRRSH